ncbi:MAG: hypothetical protein R3345_06610 [Fulvivirga sp.]|nr:hypothetical protein [Fulvivirga sp.]
MKKSRRKFITHTLLGTTAVAAAGTLTFKKEGRRAVMLTEEGELVAVDLKMLPDMKRQASDEEIHEWVKRRKDGQA